ncbi:CrcB family protein, partial [Rhizobium ruizarguesonis]
SKGVLIAYLIVFLGAGIGGALRHGINQLAARLFGMAFPYGTLTFNVAGSLLMGILAEYFAFRIGASQEIRLFLTTGVLCGFT